MKGFPRTHECLGTSAPLESRTFCQFVVRMKSVFCLFCLVFLQPKNNVPKVNNNLNEREVTLVPGYLKIVAMKEPKTPEWKERSEHNLNLPED
jgi:hypothetical protein